MGTQDCSTITDSIVKGVRISSEPVSISTCTVPVGADELIVTVAVALLGPVTFTGPKPPTGPPPTDVPGPKLASVDPWTNPPLVPEMVTVRVVPVSPLSGLRLAVAGGMIVRAAELPLVKPVPPELVPLRVTL